MIVVGISGASCSGKTTLARHLRHVVHDAEILYLDDFYKPDSALPRDAAGAPDWDVPASFDVEAVCAAIERCRREDRLPGRGETREERNSESPLLLTAFETAALAQFFAEIVGGERVLVVEGLYLFDEGSPLGALMDVRVICPANFEILKARREARPGYHTAEGYWMDPPNYYATHVWPRFLDHNGYLYAPGFQAVSAAARAQGIWMPRTMNMPECLREVGLEIALARGAMDRAAVDAALRAASAAAAADASAE